MTASRTLILMRHAAAGHQGARRDRDRPLTAGGTRDAAAAGAWIRGTLPQVDAVWCSTAVRTRQTLAATGVNAPTNFVDELYGGGIEDILEQIALTPESAITVLVVGHAPGIPATAAELVTVAALAAADSATAPSGAEDSMDGRPGPAGLESFSAGAVAVLTTRASWASIAGSGAELATVRHPDH